eukprot:1186809-Prorocentrum_minimum.AAC.8
MRTNGRMLGAKCGFPRGPESARSCDRARECVYSLGTYDEACSRLDVFCSLPYHATDLGSCAPATPVPCALAPAAGCVSARLPSVSLQLEMLQKSTLRVDLPEFHTPPLLSQSLWYAEIP